MLAFNIREYLHRKLSPWCHVKLQGDYDKILQQTARVENEEHQKIL